MAQLSNTDRLNVTALLMRDLSNSFTETNLTKIQLKAAIDAVDTWVDDNSVAFNNNLPAEAKANLTAKQKAQLLFLVLQKRWEVI